MREASLLSRPGPVRLRRNPCAAATASGPRCQRSPFRLQPCTGRRPSTSGARRGAVGLRTVHDNGMHRNGGPSGKSVGGRGRDPQEAVGRRASAPRLRAGGRRVVLGSPSELPLAVQPVKSTGTATCRPGRSLPPREAPVAGRYALAGFKGAWDTAHGVAGRTRRAGEAYALGALGAGATTSRTPGRPGGRRAEPAAGRSPGRR
jgi:hypothetical protein